MAKLRGESKGSNIGSKYESNPEVGEDDEILALGDRAYPVL